MILPLSNRPLPGNEYSWGTVHRTAVPVVERAQCPAELWEELLKVRHKRFWAWLGPEGKLEGLLGSVSRTLMYS